MKITIGRLLSGVVALLLLSGALLGAKEWTSGILWQEPPVIDPGGPDKAPSDAIVLFGGEGMSAWHNGEKCEVKDGAFTLKNSGIHTKERFGDMQLHLEFASPEEVKGSGQGRGNSGVYIMGKYEVQILDSFDNKTYFDGQCASIYKQSPPLVNACRGPGQWQTYDIIFNAPRFNEDGTVAKPAAITVLQNGVLVQNHYELVGGTAYDKPPSYAKHPEKLPLNLQYHGNPVRFRNIWVREIKPLDKTLPEIKPTEPTAEEKPIEEKPAEEKPAEVKPEEAKPAEVKGADPVE